MKMSGGAKAMKAAQDKGLPAANVRGALRPVGGTGSGNSFGGALKSGAAKAKGKK